MSKVNCAVCDQQRHTLNNKKSDILTNTSYLICDTCLSLGHEPRWIVALGYRSGATNAKKYITNRLYPGEEILVREVVN